MVMGRSLFLMVSKTVQFIQGLFDTAGARPSVTVERATVLAYHQCQRHHQG